MYESCQRVQQMDSSMLMCLDWILASSEYTEFVSMMLEFKVKNPYGLKLSFRMPKNGTMRPQKIKNDF